MAAKRWKNKLDVDVGEGTIKTMKNNLVYSISNFTFNASELFVGSGSNRFGIKWAKSTVWPFPLFATIKEIK